MTVNKKKDVKLHFNDMFRHDLRKTLCILFLSHWIVLCGVGDVAVTKSRLLTTGFFVGTWQNIFHSEKKFEIYWSSNDI